MPRLWNETIEEHRRAVHDAILETTVKLVARHGLASVTMSGIAAETGIGRATLYKYFPDLDAILRAWHERQVTGHLEELSKEDDLQSLLTSYALMLHEHHGSELAALLHAGEHVARARVKLTALIRDLIAGHRDARKDVPPAELATYSLHALAAAGTLRSRAAVRRLVKVTMTALTRRSR